MSVRLTDRQVSFIQKQTDNFNAWVKDAVDMKINKQEKLHNTMHKIGLYVQKIDATQYIIRTISKAEVSIEFDDKKKDTGIISFRFSALVGYSIRFYFHKVYLQDKDDFYEFDHKDYVFYHNFSTDGYLNGDTEIDFNAWVITKHLTKTINIDNLNNKENG